MAAGLAKPDTGRARTGYNRLDQHRDPPGRSSQKRHRPAESKDDDILDHRRKSRKIQEGANRRSQNALSESARPTRRSPRLRGRQLTKSRQTAKGGKSQVSNPRKEEGKQYPEKYEGIFKASSKQQGVHTSSKRRRDEDQREVLQAKRPRRSLAQHTEARLGLDTEGSIQTWLDESRWSRKASTEVQTEVAEAVIKMPRKAAAILPSPDNSSESTTSASRKSEKSTANVHDTDYRQSLRYRNIYIERENPPLELMRRAQRIIARSRISPELDDSTIDELKRTSRRLQDDAEDKIIKQLVPDIIPAMKRIPDQRLEMNADQPWFNSVPVPLDPDMLTTPLPLPKPKPDLTFGYSQVAFTHKQLTTIDLLVDDQFGRSYAVPDQKIRFPSLQIEFKSQAKNGTHYIATNQAAGAGAIALSGHIDLLQRGAGLKNFDYEEPQYFSISMDHELVRINVHWLKAPTEGGQHSFHVEGLSQHLLRDERGIKAVSRAIKNILDHGTDARLRALCGALDAYRDTVIRDREAANVPRSQELGIVQPQIGNQARKAPPDSRAYGATPCEKEDDILRPPDELAEPLQAGRRPRRALKTMRGEEQNRDNSTLKARRVSTRRTSRAVGYK